MLWLSIIVLLPLAAVLAKSLENGVGGLIDAIDAPAARAALLVTIAVSAIVALINAVLGTLIAWVLVRDEFPGKRVVNAIIDLPFALPTIVASIVLLSLYGPSSPIGVHLNATRPALVLALAFVTLPVRRARRPARPHRGRPRGRAGRRLARRRQLDDLPPDRPARARPGDPHRRRAGLRAGDRRVRLGRPHRRRHPAPDRGRLAVHRQADRDRPPGQRRGGLGRAAAHRLRRAARPAPRGRARRARGRRRHDRHPRRPPDAAHDRARATSACCCSSRSG